MEKTLKAAGSDKCSGPAPEQGLSCVLCQEVQGGPRKARGHCAGDMQQEKLGS